MFLDEVQVVPQIIAKLRWFFEELPELPVIAAGSLLDFSLNNFQYSMPVGRVQFFYLEPLSFKEFLIANGKDQLAEYISHFKLNDELAKPIHDILLEQVALYDRVGGLPEAVATYIATQSLSETMFVQDNILSAYRSDFNKYPSRIDQNRLNEVFDATPRILGEKFKYSKVNPDVQSRSLKLALDLLCTARVCHKVQAVTASGIPLSATVKQKHFKIISLDMGLNAAAMQLSPLPNDSAALQHFINQRGLSEQFVGQQLRLLQPFHRDPTLYYWMREDKTSNAEIDYIITHRQTIIPIEVKSGKTGTLKSLHYFMQQKKLNKAVRFNADLPTVTEVQTIVAGDKVRYQLLSLPFYLVSEVNRLLD